MKFSKFEKFEINDIRCLLAVFNVVLVLCFGRSLAWVGIGIAALGILKDIVVDKKMNGLVMHSANILMSVLMLFKA